MYYCTNPCIVLSGNSILSGAGLASGLTSTAFKALFSTVTYKFVSLLTCNKVVTNVNANMNLGKFSVD